MGAISHQHREHQKENNMKNQMETRIPQVIGIGRLHKSHSPKSLRV